MLLAFTIYRLPNSDATQNKREQSTCNIAELKWFVLQTSPFLASVFLLCLHWDTFATQLNAAYSTAAYADTAL